MSETSNNYTWVDSPEGLAKFIEEQADVDWLAFDTEFIGEKRYYTLLCLIQVASPAGVYLIDPLAIDNLDGFIDLIEDPKIVKLTHAGDNDYRLFYQEFKCIPQNLFDTQIAAGFVDYRYPTSFGKLIEAELKISLGKGFAVTDWQRRPMTGKQIQYALNDVIYLKELYDSLVTKLKAKGRLDWALEECAIMTSESYYYRDPYHEALNSKLLQTSRKRDRLFLLRLFSWRRAEAERKDYSKEMILPSKIFSPLVRSIRAGKESLQENRRLPSKTVQRYGDIFLSFYNDEVTPEEQEVLARVPRHQVDEQEDDMLLDLLYILLKYRSHQEGISHQLVMAKSAIKKMREDEVLRNRLLGSGWRRELMGDEFIDWLKNFDRLKLDIQGGTVQLSLAD
ncbi:MAG: ribonuclease D [Bacteroidota bacterium]